ncbi:MAG: YggT family protein [Rubellimicrobium sp.]|nr:YggT family protein [Rubellimicrobium sp.]
MLTILQTLLMVLSIAQFLVLAHFIMSWLIGFQVLNLRQPVVAQVWQGLNRVLEPLYGPIRRILPDMGGIDLSPIVVLIGIYALERLITNNMPAFI